MKNFNLNINEFKNITSFDSKDQDNLIYYTTSI